MSVFFNKEKLRQLLNDEFKSLQTIFYASLGTTETCTAISKSITTEGCSIQSLSDTKKGKNTQATMRSIKFYVTDCF